MTAQVTFNRVTTEERVWCRDGDENGVLMGCLIRSAGYDDAPVWANRELQQYLGESITEPSFQAAEERVRVLLGRRKARGHGRRDGFSISFTFDGLPDRETWLHVWEAIGENGHRAQITINRKGERP